VAAAAPRALLYAGKRVLVPSDEGATHAATGKTTRSKSQRFPEFFKLCMQ